MNMNIVKYGDQEYQIYQSSKYNDGIPKPPFHDDKNMMKIILNLLHNNVEVFVETGSFMGKTIFFVGKNFPNIKCYSCELNKSYYEIAHEQVKDLTNVNLMFKPSPYALYDISKNEENLFNKTTLFWLDAHWGFTPLFDELVYITNNFNKFIIIIDDFTIPNDKGFHSDGYDLESIKNYVTNYDNLNIFIPKYSSNDECCKNNPVGYIILTNIDFNTYDYLISIN